MADHPTPSEGACGCGQPLCEWCGDPANEVFWIMEVHTKCRGCNGHGQSDLPDGKCVFCGGTGQAWMGVRPGNKNYEFIYRYQDKRKAINMLRTCYPDQVRDARLGDTPVVRITQCYAKIGDPTMRRVFDGSLVR